MDEHFGQALMDTLRFTWRTTLFTVQTCRTINRLTASLRKDRRRGFDELDRAQSEADAYRSTGQGEGESLNHTRRARIRR